MRFRLFLWISLSLNIFLIVLLLAGRQRQSREGDLPDPSVSQTPADVSSTVPSEAAKSVSDVKVSFWKSLGTADFKALVQRLRDAEFSEETVRDIASGEVTRSLKLKKLGSIALPDLAWWESGVDQEYRGLVEVQQVALRTERDQLLTQLLGGNWDRGRALDSDLQPVYGPELADVDAKAAKTAREIDLQFQARIRNYESAQELAGEPVTEAELGKIEEARRAALGQLMNEKQLRAYWLRFSDRARKLRRELSQFNATSNEFLTVFNIRDRIEREMRLKHGGADKASLGLRNGLKARGNAEIKAALGRARYQAYSFNLDPLYRNAAAFLATHGGVPDKALHLYELSQMSKLQWEAIQKDETKDEFERREELERTRRQLDENLKQVLGPDTYRRYRESGANFLESVTM
jgi:hypothetical protein